MQIDHKKIRLFFIFLVCIIAFLSMFGIAAGADIYLYGSSSDLEFVPADHKIESDYNDGVGVVTVTGWLNLLYWKDMLTLYLCSTLDYFKETSLGIFTRAFIYPTLIFLLSSLSIFIFFSRRKSPETNPASTPAKLLEHLRVHPVSSELTIMKALHRSRGSVAYQLHCLEHESKIFSAEINGRRYYATRPINTSSLETVAFSTMDDTAHLKLLTFLFLHPHVTRREIEDGLGLTPGAVRYSLQTIDKRLLVTGRKGKETTFALSKQAGRIVAGEITITNKD